jgi:drug/metabolite transporter (DMT)-like permease
VKAIARVTALESVLITTVEPILNPLWVALFLGELPGPWAVGGGVLVLAAVTTRGVLTARGEGEGRHA